MFSTGVTIRAHNSLEHRSDVVYCLVNIGQAVGYLRTTYADLKVT